MQQKKDYQEQVSEADFDLFYGFIDSVLEETRNDDDNQADEKTLTAEVAEWAPEPFEEFLVGMPSQESGKYYSLQILTQQMSAALPQQRKSHSTSIGLAGGLLAAASIMFSAYYFTTESDDLQLATQTHAKLDKIEQGLNAVELNIKSVQSLEHQVKLMAGKLTELSTLISTRPAQAEVTASAPVSNKSQSQRQAQQRPKTLQPLISEKPLHVKKQGPWVVNLASTRSHTDAANMLKSVRELGIDAESIRLKIKGRLWTRIRVIGFNSKRQAQQAMAELARKTRFSSVWVGKR